MQSERICTTDGTSVRIDQCALRLSDEPWSYSERHRDDLAAYWQEVLVEPPKMFDGTVHVLTAHALYDGHSTGYSRAPTSRAFFIGASTAAKGRRATGSGHR
jgi:hypothetical protein